MARWAETSAETARGSVIAVVSAKGGVGKSTIASNLSLALKQLTVQEVVLVDADVQFGESALLLDAVDLDMSMLDLVRNEAEFTRQSIAGYLRRHETGLDMLAAPLEPPDWRAVRPEQLVAISQGLAEGHEYVILDTPSLLLEVTNAALHEAAEVLLVTSFELTSIKSTKTALRMLESWSIPSDRIRLIINNSTRATGLTADDVAGATAIDVTLTIEFDPKVGETSQSGVPIVLSNPDSPFALSIDTLARQLAGMPLESARSGSRRSRFGLLRRRRKASNDAVPDAAPAEAPSVEAEPADDAAVDQLPASGEAVRSE